MPRLDGVQIALTFSEGEQHVLLSGEDVSEAIRTPEVSMAASAVSAIPAVRAFLLSLQKELAAANNVIMDGRDIGTVILPDAQLKIFLTASPQARAQRRFAQLQEKGEAVSYDEVLRDIQKRDEQDMTRAAAPLKPAPDARLVDTSDCTLEESIARVRELVRDVLGY